VLEAYGPPTLAEEATVELLGSLANQAAGALENARLYGELAEHERQLRELVGKLVAAQEEERRHVAHEVHDGLAQMMVAVQQHLQAFAKQHPPDSPQGQKKLDWTLELVQQTVEEARRVIAGLRPSALDDFGLATAIRLQVEALRSEGWKIDYEETLGDKRLPTIVETALYRVAQEALTNVRKHAGTRRACLKLGRLGQEVRLRVRDRGRGFREEAAPASGGLGERVGISGMRERVALLGGEFKVCSRPGVGTLVVAKVPLKGAAEETS
jgi:signal transduction histidine kinase